MKPKEGKEKKGDKDEDDMMKEKEKEKERSRKQKEKGKREKNEEEEEIKPRSVIATLSQDSWPYTHNLLIDMAKVGGWVYLATNT